MRARYAENALHTQLFQEADEELADRYLHESVAATTLSRREMEG